MDRSSDLVSPVDESVIAPTPEHCREVSHRVGTLQRDEMVSGHIPER